MKFYKVSYNQFLKTIIDNGYTFCDESKVKECYDNIKLPKRATKGSAGYDFFTPMDLVFKNSEFFSNLIGQLSGKTILIPTGIRAEIDEDCFLAIFPRSGLGFKHRIQLDNTVGIIDSDYFYSDNEGHIMIKLTMDSFDEEAESHIKTGEAFAQGIFIKYGITEDDNTIKTRNGGFGSTDKKED